MKLKIHIDDDGEIRLALPDTYYDRYLKKHWITHRTIDLPVEPEKKEVEKVIIAKTQNSVTDLYKMITNDELPLDAYDITVHYKIKE